ncbi:hypothetical protein N7470_010188 [Penicillium chermesinum]|nr:hypothetical protein N7470_010188 [Penicillium chermesinum]
MPHKITNDSNSTLASGGSNNDQVVATEVRGMTIYQPGAVGTLFHPISAIHDSPPPDFPHLLPSFSPESISRCRPANADVSPLVANPVRKPPVIIHNKGGQIYDETRPSDWDKQRWK